MIGFFQQEAVFLFTEVRRCRICSSGKLEKYLSLGNLPLANNLVDPAKESPDPVFPLEVLLCKNCFLSQLSVVVSPELLFSDYAYRTSISETFRKHFAGMAREAKKFFSSPEQCLALDIASNDGCMLKEFSKAGFKVLGVDPAKNLAEIAEREGVPTLVEFWNEGVAEKIAEKKGKAHFVAASNVFAHVHDVHGFLKAVKKVLHEKGVFVVEFPYALHLVEKNEFDTIYHEHLSYFLVKPLLKLFECEGLKIFDIKEIAIHGGSIRVFAAHKENDSIKAREKNIAEFPEKERKKRLYEPQTYADFAEKTREVKKAFLELISRLREEKKIVAGYGAAAKASTLLHYCGIGKEDIKFIVDDAPTKQNKAFAGNRIPILPGKALETEKPDYLALFAWTIAGELIDKTKDYSEGGGQYIIPLPFPRIVKGKSGL